MSFDADDEILNDFLVEAGEILEALSEQLIDLEHNPEDTDILNAVFRGFHTIKGGASFLSLDSLVNICHVAEDVFNILRQGERVADATLMDVVLKVLDELNNMFSELRAGQEPTAAPLELHDQLANYAAGGDVASSTPAGSDKQKVEPELPIEKQATQSKDEIDITDQEYEEILEIIASDAPDNKTTAKTFVDKPASTNEDEITEDEFDALLDELHGKGNFKVEEQQQKEVTTPSSDEISEQEFDELLDNIHGKGKHGSVSKPQVKPESIEQKQKPKQDITPPKTKQPAKESQAVQGETSVRVDTKRLDDIMNLVGELVLVRNRLATLEATQSDEDTTKAVANLDGVTADLQTAVMKTRMQPIKKVFGRFPRVVRDLARSLNKEVELTLYGEDTDLDKNLVEALADPLVHLVRNSVDHGIERPDVRETAGKSRIGHVVLSATQEGDHILLTIKDDGAGMDPDVLRNIAVEKELMDADAAARLSDKECYSLIFSPGFSTKAEISDISGRGVGMDVVKTRIVQLNGSLEIESEKGVGSTILIKVPLTLAIMPTLMIKLGEQIFALPLVNVNEIFHLDLTRTNIVDGQKVIIVREKTMPLFYLSDWMLKGGGVHSDKGHVVVVNVGSQQVGFVVDQLIGQEEVVIKPLGVLLQGTTEGLSGATIRGDGRIALILDIPSMMKTYVRKM